MVPLIASAILWYCGWSRKPATSQDICRYWGAQYAVEIMAYWSASMVLRQTAEIAWYLYYKSRVVTDASAADADIYRLCAPLTHHFPFSRLPCSKWLAWHWHAATLCHLSRPSALRTPEHFTDGAVITSRQKRPIESPAMLSSFTWAAWHTSCRHEAYRYMHIFPRETLILHTSVSTMARMRYTTPLKALPSLRRRRATGCWEVAIAAIAAFIIRLYRGRMRGRSDAHIVRNINGATAKDTYHRATFREISDNNASFSYDESGVSFAVASHGNI